MSEGDSDSLPDWSIKRKALAPGEFEALFDSDSEADFPFGTLETRKTKPNCLLGPFLPPPEPHPNDGLSPRRDALRTGSYPDEAEFPFLGDLDEENLTKLEGNAKKLAPIDARRRARSAKLRDGLGKDKALPKGKPLPKSFGELSAHPNFEQLFVDGKSSKANFLYEEPSYFYGMKRGFKTLVEQSDGRRPTADLLELLNVECTMGVHPHARHTGEALEHRVGIKGSDAGGGFGLGKKNSTSDGMEVLEKRLEKGGELHGFAELVTDPVRLKDEYGPGTPPPFLDHPLRKREETRAKMDEILEQYQVDVTKAKDNKSKLAAIVHCTQLLDQLHPFSDGNVRTLVMLFMNGELAKHGMTPSIMDNPNEMDAMDEPALCTRVEEGQQRFLKAFQSNE
jgi:hypothetical protein